MHSHWIVGFMMLMYYMLFVTELNGSFFFLTIFDLHV